MSEPASKDYVRIFDTTLRDGEQSPGATLTSSEKLEVAEQLARLGVDVIEAGFPAASPDDLEAVRRIAAHVGQNASEQRQSPPIICGLARTIQGDVDAAWQAVREAAHPRIHTFIATSPIHREHKLNMDRAQVLERIRTIVSYAKGLCADIEFSTEDAGRTETDFLYEAISMAIAHGASTINIPDTVGYTTPAEFGALIAGIRQHVDDIDKVILSVHCHNDLGLATANSLAGLQSGARQVEVAMNGIGERAGNTALEEVVMALHTRPKLYGLRTGIVTEQLQRTSKLVSNRTGMMVQPNKAIIGANAFAHEAGIHQDGVLKNEATYEIMRPETVGVSRSHLVLGKHSGRHALSARLGELGYSLQTEALDNAFEQFKRIADRKKVITDADLLALVTAHSQHAQEFIAVQAIQISSGSTGMPTATVRLSLADGSEQAQAALGTGPVDALFKAIDTLTDEKVELLEYSVHAVTEGIDALGEVSVRLRAQNTHTRLNPQRGQDNNPIFHGYGADTDVLMASAKAYIAALNRMIAARHATPSSSPSQHAVNDHATNTL